MAQLQLTGEKLEMLARDYLQSNDLQQDVANRHGLTRRQFYRIKESKRFKRAVAIVEKGPKHLTSTDIIIHVDREMKLHPYKEVIEGLKQLTEGEEKGDQLLLLGLGRIAGFLQIEQIHADYHNVISMMDAIRGTYAKE